MPSDPMTVGGIKLPKPFGGTFSRAPAPLRVGSVTIRAPYDWTSAGNADGSSAQSIGLAPAPGEDSSDFPDDGSTRY